MKIIKALILSLTLLLFISCSKADKQGYTLVSPETTNSDGQVKVAIYKKGTNNYIIGNVIQVRLKQEEPIYILVK